MSILIKEKLIRKSNIAYLLTYVLSKKSVFLLQMGEKTILLTRLEFKGEWMREL